MNESLKNEKAVREYLFGKVSDETLREEFEELLFLDEDFCTLAEMVEDEIINEFVFERLSAEDSDSFTKTLKNNQVRREKVALTKAIKEKAQTNFVAEKETNPSFFESLAAFFRQPKYVGAFAVLLVGIFAVAFWFLRSSDTNELAELNIIYKQERPFETRISEFDYAPLVVTRGAAEEREKNKLRIIENKLLEAVEKNPSAENYYNLGVFHLSQQKFADATKEFEQAVRLDEKNAKFRNGLGSALFETAERNSDGNKFELLSKSLEEFEKALQIDAAMRSALFNKALVLQEIPLYNRAKEAWQKYLEIDKDSGWAIEARKNLERLEQLKTTSKTKEQVLEDFLAAYRNQDEKTAWKINSQTREMISGVRLPDQLSRRFLEAKIRGDSAQTTESIEALKFIGNLEKEKNADFFVSEMADYYANVSANEYENLLNAKNLLQKTYKISVDGENESAKKGFAETAEIFAKSKNTWEEKIAQHWIAFSDTSLKNLSEAHSRFAQLEKDSLEKRHKWLQATAAYRLSNVLYFQNKYSDADHFIKLSDKIFTEIADTCGQRNVSAEIAVGYAEIGEINIALKFVGKAILAENLYYEAAKQNWRNQGNAAEILLKFPLVFTSLQFALEHAETAKTIADKEYIFNSLNDIAFGYSAVGKYDQALETTQEQTQLIAGFGDEKARKIFLVKTILQKAHIKRLAKNCESAIADYDETVKLYADFPESKIELYETHKGRLLCYEQLNQTQNLQSELKKVLDLLEKHRSEIVEEQSRNSFFDREQTVTDIAVKFELANQNPQRAFETAEKAKARSLLDFMQGEVSIDNAEIRFATVTKNLDLTEIQRRMSTETQIVEYAVLPDKIAIWLIKKETFDYFETKVSATDLENKVRNYLQKIVTEKANVEQTKVLSNEFYELLLAPILPKLDAAKTLCFIPDKSLYQIPFASLFSKQTEKFLIENFAVLYAPSASIFVIASETARQKQNVKDETILSVGNPKFDFKENPNLSDLPAAEIEAKEIGKFYQNAKNLIGSEAVKETVLNELREKNIFHFAGHYVTNDVSAPNSKLLLNGDLRVFELARMRLTNTKLVILSACQTGIERVYYGEGAIGIARTFLAIGSPTVLASGWKVESDATKDLMIKFHRNRKEKSMPSAESLRQAQIEIMRNPQTNAPFYWSAFVLIGGHTNY